MRLPFPKRAEIALPLLFFAVLWLHGSLIWVTDDEAYYWVLAQKPAFGYAYHPPAVAWLIALSTKLLGGIFGANSPALVRLPGIGCMGAVLALALRWLKERGVPEGRLFFSGAVLLSFAGIFSLSWMMVPDLPLFLGWTFAFVSIWELCFAEEADNTVYLAAASGIALSLISKYSAVLTVGSAGLSILLWARPERRWKAIASIVLGALIGVLPTLIWNAAHDWSSILWQIRDRHRGGGEHGWPSASWIRYGRYWAVELLAAGLVLVPFTFRTLGVGLRSLRSAASDSLKRPEAFAALWILPAALIFCLQPLWADFKPHWSFIVWWPAALVLALRLGLAPVGKGNWLTRLGKVQLIHGGVLGAFVLLSCHLPVGGWLMRAWDSKRVIDPRWDVSNDLYGWQELRSFLKPELRGLPVIGSRYQTASQAAFSLEGWGKVTMIPTDLKSKDEWPDLQVGSGQDGSWPRLSTPVLFVLDNRYDSGPEFTGASCASVAKLQKMRWGLPAKWIEIWKCEPGAARP